MQQSNLAYRENFFQMTKSKTQPNYTNNVQNKTRSVMPDLLPELGSLLQEW